MKTLLEYLDASFHSALDASFHSACEKDYKAIDLAVVEIKRLTSENERLAKELKDLTEYCERLEHRLDTFCD